MPALNFKEIPRANSASGEQDKFELFARDLLVSQGFRVLAGPDRGQDSGRDLIICEKRKGIICDTEFKWLVSCKHKAHSGQSVTDSDEENISDRVRAHRVQGFIGFYSTLPSSGLSRKLERMNNEFEYIVFDSEKIETVLLKTHEGREIAKRYMPISYTDWEHHAMIPSELLDKYYPLSCCYCGKDLLIERKGNLVFVHDHTVEPNVIRDIYWACPGECDNEVEKRYNSSWITYWTDINDLTVPTEFLRWNIALLNRLRDKSDSFDDEAFNKLQDFLIYFSQIVLRRQSDEQKEKLKEILMLHSIPGAFI